MVMFINRKQAHELIKEIDCISRFLHNDSKMQDNQRRVRSNEIENRFNSIEKKMDRLLSRMVADKKPKKKKKTIVRKKEARPSGMVAARDVCIKYKTSDASLFKIRKRGDIKFTKIGGRYYYKMEDVDKYFEQPKTIVNKKS